MGKILGHEHVYVEWDKTFVPCKFRDDLMRPISNKTLRH